MMKRTAINRQRGFTLIEIMLVVVIIGVMLAVVVPRAWRANVDAKYGNLRQTCAELAGYANDWAKQQLESQHPGGDAVLDDYFQTLAQEVTDVTWVGDPSSDSEFVSGGNNWNSPAVEVEGRGDGPSDVAATAVVANLLPPGSGLRNPFNGLDLLQVTGDPGDPVPGAVACGMDDDDGYNYYALIFQATDGWYAGQGPTLGGLRSGVFVARVLP